MEAAQVVPVTDAIVYGWEITYRDGTTRRQFDSQEQEIYVAGENCLPRKHGLLDNVREMVFRPRNGRRLPPEFNQVFYLKIADGQHPILFRKNYLLMCGVTYICYYLGAFEVRNSGEVQEEMLVISPPFVSVFSRPSGELVFGQAFHGAIEVLRDRNAQNAIDRWLPLHANSQ